MKKDMLGVFILMSALVLSISFTSAAGITDILNSIDESTLMFFSIFIISFSFLFFALNKFFKDKPAFAGVIASVLAFLIVYWISRSEFNVSDFFYSLGLSGESVTLLITIIIVAGIIFTIVKLHADSLLVLGGLFIVASFFVYEKEVLIIIGAVLVIIRIAISLFTSKEKKEAKKGK
jgi:hypothetical protein